MLIVERTTSGAANSNRTYKNPKTTMSSYPTFCVSLVQRTSSFYIGGGVLFSSFFTTRRLSNFLFSPYFIVFSC